MSKLACLPSVTAPYPPLKDLPADLKAKSELDALTKQASDKPFGQMNRAQYNLFVKRRTTELRSVDFKWPFWVGVTAAGVALVVLAKSK
jgi:hypothetical protein